MQENYVVNSSTAHGELFQFFGLHSIGPPGLRLGESGAARARGHSPPALKLTCPAIGGAEGQV